MDEDEEEEENNKGERKHKILVLAWVVHYLLTFVFPQPPQVSKH
jgi:hypothetical protein